MGSNVGSNHRKNAAICSRFTPVRTCRGRSQDNGAIKRRALQPAEHGHGRMRVRRGSGPVMGSRWVASNSVLGCMGSKEVR